MKIFLRLLKLARPHSVKFTLAMLCMLAVGAITSSLAFMVNPALDDVFIDKNGKMLVLIPAAIILLYLIQGLANYGQTVFMTFIGQRIVADLRNSLYWHIQRQSLPFFPKPSSG